VVGVEADHAVDQARHDVLARDRDLRRARGDRDVGTDRLDQAVVDQDRARDRGRTGDHRVQQAPDEGDLLEHQQGREHAWSARVGRRL
jgi:hypothetical protein